MKGFNYIYEDQKQTTHKERFSLLLLVLDRLDETNTKEYTLRTFAPIFFWASLLRTAARNSHATSGIERACYGSKVNQMGQMAIAITLRGFTDLGRLVTPIFLSMGNFLSRFSTFFEKMKKIYQVEVWFFCETLHRIPAIHLTSSLSCVAVSKVKNCENDGNIWNY